MATITLITGGMRSGKSRYALSLALNRPGPRFFIATAEPIDDEMQQRIKNHKKERGDTFITLEEPLDPANAVKSLSAGAKTAVVDCLTVWLGNLLHHRENTADDFPEITRFLRVLDEPPCDLVIVSNEIGMGVIPHNYAARRFLDICGHLNQRVAERAERVVLMTCGIPTTVKEKKA